MKGASRQSTIASMRGDGRHSSVAAPFPAAEPQGVSERGRYSPQSEGVVSSTVSEIAFDIGWDFARFGRFLDAATRDIDIRAGFAAGHEHFRVPQHVPDRYISKWLQLRLNAFKRRRLLNPEVTPEYLKRIDCPTCPITLVTLTHGTLRDSDWSVDRINNDGAYAAGNLMIMSVKANRAKGSKHYLEVARIAESEANAPTDSLCAPEWARLACVMAGAEQSADPRSALGPLLTRIPEDSRVPLYYVFQQIVLNAASTAAARNRAVKSCNRLHPSNDRRLGLRFAAERLAIALKRVEYPYDALADAVIQRFLRESFTSLPRTSVPDLLVLCSEHGAERCEPTIPDAWSIQTLGRF
jgi:hypothetical protein